MTKFVYARCSVIKYRGGAVALYPLAKYQEEVRPLHGKRVHVIVIVEEQDGRSALSTTVERGEGERSSLHSTRERS